MEQLSKEFLISRGYCCALGCNNCPYTKPRIFKNTKLEKNETSNLKTSTNA
jgi:hypothetical protein